MISEALRQSCRIFEPRFMNGDSVDLLAVYDALRDGPRQNPESPIADRLGLYMKYCREMRAERNLP